MLHRWTGFVAVGLGFALAAGWSAAALTSGDPAETRSTSAPEGLEPVSLRSGVSVDRGAVITGTLPRLRVRAPKTASVTKPEDSTPTATPGPAATATATAVPTATAPATVTPRAPDDGDIQP